MEKLLTDTHYNTWLSLLDVKLDKEFEKIKTREWTAENFKFATAVSVMSSSKIEGETLEVDSYVKHKMLDIEYLPNLTESQMTYMLRMNLQKTTPYQKNIFIHVILLPPCIYCPNNKEVKYEKATC